MAIFAHLVGFRLELGAYDKGYARAGPPVPETSSTTCEEDNKKIPRPHQQSPFSPLLPPVKVEPSWRMTEGDIRRVVQPESNKRKGNE
jgi:hypothetical protein